MPGRGVVEVVSVALSPATMGAVAAVALASGGWSELAVAPALGFLMGVAFLSILPMAPIAVEDGVYGLMSQRIESEEKRIAVLTWSAPVYAGGSVAFVAVGWDSMAYLAACYAVASAMLAAITLRLRVSLHAAGVSLPAVALALMRGLPWSALLLLLPVVAWARIRAGVHTPRQVAVGAVAGGLVPLALWLLLLRPHP
ncbi:MAG: hypothetical protein QI223_06525 [Candidatus Korarchaeota archaeon]|nr:hypothetical protein [Candidatus Korarchaeota archaeon]